MKKIKFVITRDYNDFLYNIFDRDYLTVWSGNVTWDDTFGVFWTSFENFKDIQHRIKSPEDGTITLFDTEEEAVRVAHELNVTRYTVRKILWEV